MKPTDAPIDATITATEGDAGVVSNQPMAGDRVGRYVILEELGAGGVGVVYKAYDPELDRAIALKFLHSRDPSADKRLRFQREARTIASLRHPNVVTVYDVGVHGEAPYLAMELVLGGSLRDWLRRSKPGLPAILRAFREAAEGLGAAHRAGIVHRDFKPSNVLVDESGNVRVADFGLARVMETHDVRESEDDELGSSPSASERVTQTGSILGTPAYMAPEQLSSGTVNDRADQFAFSASLYEALVGARLERSDDDVGTPVVQFDSGGVPTRLQRVLRRGLAVDPRDRYPSMAALVADFGPARGRSAGLAIALGLAVVVGAGVAWSMTRSAEERPCSDLDAPMRPVWNDGARAALTRAFVGSGHKQGAEIAAQLSDSIDRRVREWTRDRVSTCEATGRGEQSAALGDRRMVCYLREVTRLRAYTSVWLDGPSLAAVEGAPMRLSRSPDGSECSAAAMLSTARTPATREAREIIELVDRGQALRALQRQEEAAGLAEQALERARALGDDGVLAEALFASAEVLQAAERQAESAELLYEAAARAGAAGHDRLLARIVSDLTFVNGDRLGRYDEAVRLGRVGAALVARAGDDPQLRARLNSDLGVALQKADRLEESERYLREALQAQRDRRDDQPYELVSALNRLGNTVFYAGRPDEALKLFSEGVDLLERADGRSTRLSRAGLNNVAMVLADRGDRDKAIAMWRRVEAEELAAYGPSSAELVYPYVNLAWAFIDTGRFDEAASYSAKTRDLYQTLGMPDHPHVALACAAGARAEVGRDAPGAALPLLDRAERLHRAASDRPSENLARVHVIRGDALLDLGRSRDARAQFELAAEMLRSRGSPEWQLAAAEFGMARVLWAGGERNRARALARRVHDELVATDEDDGIAEKAIETWLSSR